MIRKRIVDGALIVDNDPEKMAEWERMVEARREIFAAPSEAGWNDATLDADHWCVTNMSPIQAAMLLSGFNPNEISFESARMLTSGKLELKQERGPEYLIRLVQRLEDVDKKDHKNRTLRDWHQTAKENKLTYHPWIDRYIESTRSLVQGIESPTKRAEPNNSGTGKEIDVVTSTPSSSAHRQDQLKAAADTSGVAQVKVGRRDLVSQLIDDAIRISETTEPGKVFLKLREWAQEDEPRAPLVGVTTDGKIQWDDSNYVTQELSRNALAARLSRAKSRR